MIMEGIMERKMERRVSGWRLISACLLACAVSSLSGMRLGAQTIDPTVEVTRDYAGRQIEPQSDVGHEMRRRQRTSHTRTETADLPDTEAGRSDARIKSVFVYTPQGTKLYRCMALYLRTF